MTVGAIWPEAPVTNTRMGISNRRVCHPVSSTIAPPWHLVSSTRLKVDDALETGRAGSPDERRDRTVRPAGIRGDDRRRDRGARRADQADLLSPLLRQA